MKAAVYRRFGGPDVVKLEDVPRPEPRATEVLIRVHASTVSSADRRARSKDVPAGLALPSSFVLGFTRPRRPILGMDVAGVIEAVGDRVTRFAPGDQVIAMLGSRFGGHAEYAVASETSAIARMPASTSFEAVALVFGGITARAFLRQAGLDSGTRVLVNGASGAVGSAVVQLAKAAGATVFGVCGANNESLVTSLGADHVLDYRAVDFAAGGAHYDIVVDCVGNAPVTRVWPIVAPGGAVLLVAGDLRSALTASRLGHKHGLTVVTAPGPYLASDLEHLVDLADDGMFRPVIDRSYPFDQIVDAHRYVDTNHKRGNVVIDVA